jgi:hypothetical protein
MRANGLTAPLISSPAGGAVIDVEARDALAAILQFMKSIGMCAT